MKDHRIVGVHRRLGFKNGFNVPPIGRSRSLSLWWAEYFDVVISLHSKHVINARLRPEMESRWVRVTGV